ncbi:Sphingomyelin synthase-related 1 [Thelohanellus kitauei]|uniref:Sphingomyelin synthase-related 1 n=1 Tax=Thelohanellus kitauei TaxID=669202 RepID=A0A0C2MFU1_THEKT|nr:Sphingomyelin synthase-related 1 [Thelohanellus kitauei]
MIFFIKTLLSQEKIKTLKRFFVCCASIYLIRSTFFVTTQMSIPHSPDLCPRYTNITFGKLILQGFLYISSFGLSFTKTQSCGDYLFSGHTAFIINLALFLCFCKRFIYRLKPKSVFHDISLDGDFSDTMHYTVDVVVAIFVAFTIFLSYHSFVEVENLRDVCEDENQLTYISRLRKLLAILNIPAFVFEHRIDQQRSLNSSYQSFHEVDFPEQKDGTTGQNLRSLIYN